MAPDSVHYATELALAIRIADAADQITMARFGARDLIIETKPDRTPVSDADRGVELAVREMVAAQRPDDGVLGEEYGEHIGTSGRRWIIDPVDGTKNFVRGVPVWATVLGLQEPDGQIVAATVSAPALGRRWWATLGGGAWLTEPGHPDPRRLQVSRVSEVTDAYLSTTNELAWHDSGLGTQWTSLTSAVWQARAMGDFWSHLLVAEGAIDIAAEPELNLYDVAGVSLVVTEAGGRFTGLDGVDGPDRGNGVSTNGLLHAEVLRMLAG